MLFKVSACVVKTRNEPDGGKSQFGRFARRGARLRGQGIELESIERGSLERQSFHLRRAGHPFEEGRDDFRKFWGQIGRIAREFDEIDRVEQIGETGGGRPRFLRRKGATGYFAFDPAQDVRTEFHPGLLLEAGFIHLHKW
jgi:hypothetical protein